MNLMLNISAAAAAAAYNGKKYVPCRQIPNLSGAKDVKVYFCENEKVTGEATYVTAKAQKAAFEGATMDSYGLYVAWEVADVVRYPEAKSASDFGLKRAPQEWCYLK